MPRPWAAGGILALLLAGLAGVAWALPSQERQEELLHRLKHDCGSCHGLTMKGGLGPPLLPQALAGRPEEDLVHIILEGVATTPMPPWKSELSEAEARWLVRLLREGVPQ